MTRRSTVFLFLPALLLLAACTGPAATDSSPSPAEGAGEREIFTPVLAHALAAPVPAPSTDGRVHLAYELELTNVLSQSVTLQAVRVLTGDATLLELSGDPLAAHTQIVGGGFGEVELGPGASGRIYLDVVVEPDAVPDTLRHELDVAPEEAVPPIFDSPLTESVAQVAVSREEAIVIGPPVTGERWLNGNSCCEVTPHRTAVNPVNGSFWAPERYAVDLVQLDEEDGIFSGPIDDIDSYAYEGADIIAVADGPVVSILSDLPEARPGSHPEGLTLEQYGGNHVVQDIGGGRYAFYAHLQPGNTAGLEVGQQLQRGDLIGALGNSGNTDAPHLHFHIMDSPLPLGSNGLPFLVEGMTLAGTITEDGLQACLVDAIPCGVAPASAPSSDPLSPLYRDILDFAAP
jgi:hypothetical protein